MIFIYELKSGVRCPFCDSIISPRARVCPKCTRDVGDDPEWHARIEHRRRLIIATVVILMVAIAVVGAVLAYSAYSDAKAEQRARAVPNWTPPTQLATSASSPSNRSAPPIKTGGFVTLTHNAELATSQGRVTVPAGTRLPLVTRGRYEVLIRYFDGGSYSVPIEVTDAGKRE